MTHPQQLYGIAPTNPTCITVTMPKHVRKTMPRHIRVEARRQGYVTAGEEKALLAELEEDGRKETA